MTRCRHRDSHRDLGRRLTLAAYSRLAKVRAARVCNSAAGGGFDETATPSCGEGDRARHGRRPAPAKIFGFSTGRRHRARHHAGPRSSGPRIAACDWPMCRRPANARASGCHACWNAWRWSSASCLVDEELLTDATEVIERVLAADPDDCAALALKAHIYLRGGRVEEALGPGRVHGAARARRLSRPAPPSAWPWPRWDATARRCSPWIEPSSANLRLPRPSPFGRKCTHS